MSKKNKSVKPAETKLQGLESLAVLNAPQPEIEVVKAVSTGLQELPEYAKWQQAQELLGEADTLYAEGKRILGEEKLDDLKARISSLQGRILGFKAETKNAVVSDAGITQARADFLGKFGKWLEQKVEQDIKKSPSYLQMAEELRKAVANAERVQELRLTIEAKEQEAQSLLDSISL